MAPLIYLDTLCRGLDVRRRTDLISYVDELYELAAIG